MGIELFGLKHDSTAFKCPIGARAFWHAPVATFRFCHKPSNSFVPLPQVGTQGFADRPHIFQLDAVPIRSAIRRFEKTMAITARKHSTRIFMITRERYYFLAREYVRF
jgi:hypothetical protein